MGDVRPEEMMKCPLCEGCGELPKKVLLERLSEKDLGAKVRSYLTTIVEAEAKEEQHDASPGNASGHDMKTWNLTHFLWRRSAKE